MAGISLSSGDLPSLDLTQSESAGSYLQNYQFNAPHSLITLRAPRAQHCPFPATPIYSIRGILDPPPDIAFLDYLRSWDDDHVARWLTNIKCSSHVETFRNNDVRGDLLLELGLETLKEMGIMSFGDRLRIVNGVKDLRNRCSPWNASPPAFTRSGSRDSSPAPSTHKHLYSNRPAPLMLSPSSRRTDLPGIFRDPQFGDSIPQTSAVGWSTTLNSTNTGSSFPPVSIRGRQRTLNPLIVPLMRTPNQFDAANHIDSPLSPASTSAGSSTNRWSSSSFGLPASPRSPPNMKPWIRSPTPLESRSPSRAHDVPSPLVLSPTDGLAPRPSLSGASEYSYTSMQIPESHSSQTGGQNRSSLSPQPRDSTSSCPTAFSPRLSPSSSATRRPSLDDLHRKLIKFVMPEEGRSCVVDVADCQCGVSVMEKVLKKVDKSRLRRNGVSSLVEMDCGLRVDGWSAYLEWDEMNGSGDPLTQAELLAVCHSSCAPCDPVKERGLILRKSGQTKPSKDLHQIPGESPSHTRPTSPMPPQMPTEPDDQPDAEKPLTSAKTIEESKVRGIKMGTKISIFSVHDAEKPDPPSASSFKKSPKLRDLLCHRPAGELIPQHLTEYLPFAERNAPRKARSQDKLSGDSSEGLGKGRSDSRMSASRFSESSQGSRPVQRSKFTGTLIELWESWKGAPLYPGQL
ncbi:hypothetical protein AZE42_01530 [Rhizopogon vesiculosus]|uniref:SAM domain-containing protein n=1 Tax=Rhizopogon vesiculosus TaxID=180088 RepID=A0A1J8QPU9_9AGAM|nr:hypothetical protein AZE42_01530 [Rhizopogon vesiculosus]